MAKIVATYDYTDEGRRLLYQNVCFEPKDFRQRRPDGKGIGPEARRSRGGFGAVLNVAGTSADRKERQDAAPTVILRLDKWPAGG